MQKVCSVRSANWEDAPSIVDIVSSSADWYRPFLSSKDMGEHEVDLAWARDNFCRRRFFVAEYESGNPVGVVTFQKFGRYAYVGYCYVHTDQVGKGIGAQLLDHVQSLSRDQGLEGMVLLAHPSATWAIRAYEKYGFEALETDPEQVVRWNRSSLNDYYEEGFHLFHYLLAEEARKAS